MATTEPARTRKLLVRFAWFAVFWAGGVAVVSLVAFAIRSVFV